MNLTLSLPPYFMRTTYSEEVSNVFGRNQRFINTHASHAVVILG